MAEFSSETAEQEKKGKSGLKIVSWNINGIRTINMQEILKTLDADVLAVQETKVTRGLLKEKDALVPNYSSFFSFCKHRPGYSGVASFCRKSFAPYNVEDVLVGNLDQTSQQLNGTQMLKERLRLTGEKAELAKYIDGDGRCTMTQHMVMEPTGRKAKVTIINVYCPRLRDDPEDTVNNTELKELFHNVLEEKARMSIDWSYVLIVGDLNISHKPIDICEAVDAKVFSEDIFRKHLDSLVLPSRGNEAFVDTFRMLYPSREKAFTCWNTQTKAREKNYGTRLDYIFASRELADYLISAEIHPDVVGSDHCPVSATFNLEPLGSEVEHLLSTKHYPEFGGKQLKITSFLTLPKPVIPEAHLTNMKTILEKSNGSRPKAKKQFSFTTWIKEKKPALQDNCPTASSQLCDLRPEECAMKKPKLENLETNSVTKTDCLNKAFNANTEAANEWKKLLKGPQLRLCSGHNEPCLTLTVKKKGPNKGREFWACPRGAGSDLNSSCGYFEWVKASAKQRSNGTN